MTSFQRVEARPTNLRSPIGSGPADRDASKKGRSYQTPPTPDHDPPTPAAEPPSGADPAGSVEVGHVADDPIPDRLQPVDLPTRDRRRLGAPGKRVPRPEVRRDRQQVRRQPPVPVIPSSRGPGHLRQLLPPEAQPVAPRGACSGANLTAPGRSPGSPRPVGPPSEELRPDRPPEPPSPLDPVDPEPVGCGLIHDPRREEVMRPEPRRPLIHPLRNRQPLVRVGLRSARSSHRRASSPASRAGVL